ncbi:MAG TPA: argininosuccinate lyase [Desulfotomaculum sp.]|nr:argininosuccinate lyase [Desulfotomaculum sp.]
MQALLRKTIKSLSPFHFSAAVILFKRFYFLPATTLLGVCLQVTKLWGGRFQKDTAGLVDDFHSSISFDQRLYRYDIRGSQAHARMLARQGIIAPEEAEQIVSGLEEILADIEAGRVQFSVEAEDIHMNIEQLLTRRIGPAGKKLHTARSRNDQVALDVRLYLKDEIDQVTGLLEQLQKTLLDLAEEHLDTVMPGYTHLQRAQPVTLAHHFMAYVQMFARDVERLRDCRRRTDVLPLGAGALAGTTFPVDPAYVAEQLGFAAVAENSLDAVSDRDFMVEFVAAAALIMVHLSRFCEEIILWSSAEFAFVELDDAFSTGSSMMPQKKNPDVAELSRGKAGRVFGHLMGLLTMLKGLPLAYNKDMQEDKEALFDTVDTVKKCLTVFTPMVATMKIRRENMARAARGGFTNATDLADYLVGRGVPFREAHAMVGRLVYYCLEQGKSLEELTLDEFRQFAPAVGDDVYRAIDIRQCVAKRRVLGGPAPEAVREAIVRARERLQNQ